jgi:hypothetical protein
MHQILLNGCKFTPQKPYFIAIGQKKGEMGEKKGIGSWLIVNG